MTLRMLVFGYAAAILAIFATCAGPPQFCDNTMDPTACDASRDTWQWTCTTDAECAAQEEAFANERAVGI